MRVHTIFDNTELDVQYAELLLKYVEDDNLWGVYAIYGDIMFRLAYHNIPLELAPAEITAIFYNLLHWTIPDNEYYGINNLTLDELMETTMWFLDYVSCTIQTRYPAQAQYIIYQLEVKYNTLQTLAFKKLFTIKITSAGAYGLLAMASFVLLKLTAFTFIWIFIGLFGYLIVKNLVESYNILRASNA